MIINNLNDFLLLISFFLVSYFLLKPPSIKKTKPKLVPFGYHLHYTDNSLDRINKNVVYNKLLISEKYNLQGKPDFIFTNFLKSKYIPIELKSGTIGESPYPKQGDLLQLAAYFLIIEDLYKYKPRTGRLIYKDCMFIVRNTRKIRQSVLSTMSSMEKMLESGELQGNTFEKSSFSHCRHCICRSTVCKYCKK